MPSADVAADMEYFTSVLGGRLIFAVEGMGTRVAMVELTEDPPRILLAGHLEGDQAVLVYRVDDLAVAMRELEGRGWQREPSFEIPHGPVSSFRTPGGHRIAIYQLVRPEVGEHFAGRRDF
jgi:hypothetical protein